MAEVKQPVSFKVGDRVKLSAAGLAHWNKVLNVHKADQLYEVNYVAPAPKNYITVRPVSATTSAPEIPAKWLGANWTGGGMGSKADDFVLVA